MRTTALKKPDAFTLFELVLVCVGCSAFLLMVFSMAGAKQRAHAASCRNMNKSVSLAFRMFSNDHDDRFPWQLAATNGGSMESVLSSQTFAHFLVASNEINTPKVLSCPADREKRATRDWSSFGNSNLSYFVGIDATKTNAMMLLMGDSDLRGGSANNGMLRLAANSTVKWSGAVHKNRGNIGFTDGSVWQFTNPNLLDYFKTNGSPVVRLAIP
jgi:prepilin-type processing-associated H-X9-DG protein